MARMYTHETVMKFCRGSYVKGNNDLLDALIENAQLLPEGADRDAVIAGFEALKMEGVKLDG